MRSPSALGVTWNLPLRPFTCSAAILLMYATAPARAAEKASEQVSPFMGSFSQALGIEVPPFRGLEPKFALGYSSEGRNGFVGVGWALSGISTIERANPGRGTPKFDSTDIYMLDGQELVACQGGSVSPSCTSGGSHSTKTESYLKIKFTSGSNIWEIFGKDGTKTVFSAVHQTTLGTWRWGQTSAVDTNNNTVTYAWSCVDGTTGDCFPNSISYNGYAITFFRESRPDYISFAAVTAVGQTKWRLKSIVVQLAAGTKIRAYKLGYTMSPVTARSLLTSFQQYGKNVTLDGSGGITGGTSLPAQTFTYQNDTIGKTFVTSAPNPPTPPATVENVTWANRIKVVPTGAGNSLQKTTGTGWDAGASSTRAITSGDGYLEIKAQAEGPKMAGLSNGDSSILPGDIDFALYESAANTLYAYENGTIIGPYPVTNGDTLRVEVTNNVVRYKRNGTTFYTSTRTPTYPLLVDASISQLNATIKEAVISGALQDVNSWCQTVFSVGDFNGDGRADQLCHNGLGGGQTKVRLGNATGFDEATTWLSSYVFQKIVPGDFNNDGKADLADYQSWPGLIFVALSNGTTFGTPTQWGNASGSWGGQNYACRIDPADVGTGDYNGDGITDFSCKNVTNGYILIGLSNGATAFNFSIFQNLSCMSAQDPSELTGSLDFDGDGKNDWYCVGSQTGSMLVFLSTGSTFIQSAYGSIPGGWCGASSYILGDWNADGRTDASCVTNGKMAFSSGRAFILDGNTYGSWCGGSTDFFAADVDGDGASEMVCNNTGTPSTDIQVRKWKNNTLAAAETWKASWCNGKLRPGDFSGDGKTDLLCDSTSSPAIAGTAGYQTDVMAQANNGLGGTTQVVYTSSVGFTGAVNNPSPKFAVSTLTTTDGRGGSSTSTFTYSGALMDRKERRFLGFRTARTTLPCIAGESVCPYIETTLKQDLPSAGKPERIERRDGANTLLTAQVFEYTTNGTTIPSTSLLTGVRNQTYAGGSSKETYTTNQYDAYGNVTQTTEYGDNGASGDETTTAITYRPNTTAYIVGRVAKQITHAGAGTAGTKLAESQAYYDGASTWDQAPTKGQVTTSLNWLNPGNRYVSTAVVYDTWGNVTSVTAPATAPTTTTYDTTYRTFPVTATNPAGEVTTAQWDPVCGAPGSAMDANGQNWTYQTDALCRSTQATGPLGAFQITSYLDLGNPNLQRTVVEAPSASPGDGSGNDYAASYFDGKGRTYRTAKKGPTPAQTIYVDATFNTRGGTSSVTAPYYAGDSPIATTYAYDALDRQTVVNLPDGNDVTTTFGLWSTTTYDPNNKSSTSHFDAYGRAIAQDKALSGQTLITESTYDLLGRLVGMTDPVGNQWSWTFDTLGRNTQKADPDSGSATFVYDDAGRVTSQTDAKAQTTTFTYDTGGRLATKTNAAGTVGLTRSEPRSGYYNVGRVTTVTSPGSTTLTSDYDALGREVRQVRTLDGQAYTLERRHDAAGRLKGTTFPDGDAVGTTASPLTYDAAGRLTVIPGIITSVTYDASGRPTTQTNANGTVTAKTYDTDRGFLTNILTTRNTTTLQNLTYAIDGAGIATGVTSPFANEGWTYGYDDLYRLTSSINTSTPANSQTFQYDLVGNITYNSRIGNYTYPAPGGSRPHAPTAVAGSSYTYDNNGNLTTGGGRTLTWNADNRITQVVQGSSTTAFTYDAFGDRLKKSNGANVSRYPVGDDYEVTNGTVTKYVPAEGLGVIAKRVGLGTGATTYWLHSDRLGSIQAITDGAGAEVQRRTYRPYGDKIADSTGHVESRGFIDQRQDVETGLTYLHARFFDPGLGLFVSPDPLHPLDPGVGLHRYHYSFGSPTNGTDRSGLGCEGEGSVTTIATPNHPSVTYTSGSGPVGGCTGPEKTTSPDKKPLTGPPWWLLWQNVKWMMPKCLIFCGASTQGGSVGTAAASPTTPTTPTPPDPPGCEGDDCGQEPPQPTDKSKAKAEEEHTPKFSDPCTTGFGGRFLESANYLAHTAAGQVSEAFHVAEIATIVAAPIGAAALASQALRTGGWTPVASFLGVSAPGILGMSASGVVSVETSGFFGASGKFFHKSLPVAAGVFIGGVGSAIRDAATANDHCQ